MASIKRWGVVAGGTVAGLVLAVSGVGLALVLDLPDLGGQVVEGHVPQLVLPLVLRFLTGFVLVWIYVGFRPRFGAGRRSILAAAFAVWAPASAVVVSVAALVPLLAPLTVALVVVWWLIELAVASQAGAALYRRRAAATTRRRGRKVDAMTP